ncbi:hypothetical protein DL95DRAFT_398127 [Leptodontidium sp. 2 PMI_412]|nr:hypothetical protein DL95DRAFT_398127 [Leptodontidium sp. 2 PMI_412]
MISRTSKLDSISRLDISHPKSFLFPTIIFFCSGLGLCRFDSLSSYSFRSLLSPHCDVLSARVGVCLPVHARCAPPSRGDAARN